MRDLRRLVTTILVGAAACGGATGPDGSAPHLAIVSGDGQEAVSPAGGGKIISLAFRDSLRVRVTDATGAPLAGVSVGWSSESGTVFPALSVTDAMGYAASAWGLSSTSGWAPVGQTHARANVPGVGVAAFTADVRAGPLAREITFSPATVNVVSAPAVVTVSVHMTDDRRTDTLEYLSVQFYNPSATASIFTSYIGSLALASGTTADGIWRGTVSLPQGAESGAWTLGRLTVGSGCGPTNRFDLFDADLRARGLAWQLMVTTQPLASLVPAPASAAPVPTVPAFASSCP